MAQIIYRDSNDGKLRIGKDSDSDQLATSVYRSRSGKRLIKRDGVFVEVSDNGERPLFSVDGTGGGATVKRTNASELLRASVRSD